MATKSNKNEAKIHDVEQVQVEKKELPKQEQQNKIPYFSLFRYATNYDKTLMVVGSIAAFLNGGAMPSFSLIFGNMMNSFQHGGDEMVTQAGWNAIWFIVVAIGTAILSFTMFSTWMISGERQGIEFRKNYFKAILHQEVGWFDTINPNELNSKVANEAFAVQGAIGEKVPTFIMTFSLTFFGFLYGFIWGWQLAIVITATLPALTIITAVFSVVIQSSVMATQAAYSEAGALAEQAINAIKTVKMLDGEDYEHEKYSHLLQEAASKSMKYDLGVGMAIGLLWASSLWSYALGFWYGAKLIADQTFNPNQQDVYTVGDVMTIFFSVVTGGFSLGQAGPCVQNFAKGQAAAASMFEVLDRIPKIKMPQNPIKLVNFNGEINLQNITFSYPNRPDQIVLNSLTLQIPAGKKVALVGESGCGKSTVMQLIERFYDCDQGNVIYGGADGQNVKDLDLVDLRSRIGLVGQEPVLFATSIRENLLYGKTDATEAEMVEALKKANAWDFVCMMDKGLDTYVGIGGGQLSGGQKQRIAIARAIIKKPQVLLLDEATSALDRTNERLIQQTLDDVSKGITTLVIAHRLTTVQNADLIYVIEKGAVVEQGTHQELINKHGKYEALAKTQISNQDEEIIKENPKISGKKIVLGSLTNPQIVQQSKIETVNSDKKIKMNIMDNKSIADEAVDQYKQMQELDLLIKDKNGSDKKVYQQVGKSGQVEAKTEVDAQMGRLFNYNKQERLPFIIGIIAALANGCTFPLFSLFLSDIITVLAQSNPKLYSGSERSEKMKYVRDQADTNALYFFIIGCAAFILWAIQSFCLSYVGERLTLKLRSDTFRKLLRMPISFFDEPKNNAGTLTSRLSVDCKLINGLTSSIIGINLANFASLVCGLTIAFTSSWALTLVTLGITPLTFISGTLQAKFLQGFSAMTDEAYKDSGNLIMEAVTNIRTVFSFGNEKVILEIYSEKVRQPLQLAKEKGIKAGLTMGFSQMNIFLINAIIYYVGALFCRDIGLSVNDMFRTIFALLFATMGAGNNAAFAGDIGAAKNASKNIFEIIDAEDEFQRETRLNKKKLICQIKGDIVFNNLTFKYNSRDKNVFENLSLTVKQGQKVAFVGPSGCGKSTLMQMLMRFYEPDQGTITINGIDLTDYDIKYLRRQFGIVSQEPVLFNGSIKENIQYNLNKTTMEQIEQAAKQANAYDFIIKNQFEETQVEMKGNEKQLGQGFERQVGPKGAQISGGQKQRIAIARAILRDCNLLLLDEATSALDAASEQLVQDSLNALMVNKTTIAIAHRISTIKDSDLIYVFEDGKIVEEGTYQDLVNLRGFFYRLEQGIQQ